MTLKKQRVAILTLCDNSFCFAAYYLPQNTGDIARKFIKDPQLLSFIDAEVKFFCEFILFRALSLYRKPLLFLLEYYFKALQLAFLGLRSQNNLWCLCSVSS